MPYANKMAEAADLLRRARALMDAAANDDPAAFRRDWPFLEKNGYAQLPALIGAVKVAAICAGGSAETATPAGLARVA